MKLSSLCNRKNVLILCIIVILLYIISGFYNPLVLTRYDYTSSKVPEGFDGYRIVHISDFHCKEFGDGESDLIAMIRNAEPDLILFTGDSIDDEHSLDNYRDLITGIYDVAPIYYVNGNHEYDASAPLAEMKELNEKYQVHDLNDASVVVEHNGDSILLSGLDFRLTMRGLRNNIDYANTTCSIFFYTMVPINSTVLHLTIMTWFSPVIPMVELYVYLLSAESSVIRKNYFPNTIAVCILQVYLL